MTLTNPEWALLVENETQGWTYETFPGDLNPPFGPVWLSGDSFTLEWSYADEVSPGPLDAPVFEFELSCETAADAPPIDYGDVLRVTLSQPDGPLSRNPGTGIVTGDYGPALVERPFWVTDLTAVEKGDRIAHQATATGAFLNPTLNVRGYLDDHGHAGDLESYLETVFVTTFPIPVDAASILSGGAAPYGPVQCVLERNAAVDGHRATGVKVEDEIELLELLDGVHALWLAPPGWDGRGHGCAFVWDTYDAQTDVNGTQLRRALSYPWDPECSGPAVAPFQLVYASSVLSAEFLGTAAGPTLAVLDACAVVAGPEWRKDATGDVGLAEYKGYRRASAVPSTDTEVTIASTDQGAGVRSIESLAYLRNTVTPALDFDSYGGRRAADHIFLADSGQSWVFDTFEVLPRRMTDAEWAAVGPIFWPQLERQHTLVVTNIEDEDNVARRDVWFTLMGCKFEIDDGHLVITPACRAFVPLAINDVADAATWAELDAAHPATTFAQADPALLWGTAALASL